MADGRERPAVIALSCVPWSRARQRHHHLLVELARRGHRVVFVESHLQGEAGTWTAVPDLPEVPPGVTVVRLGLGDLTSPFAPWTAGHVLAAWTALGDLVDREVLRCPVLYVQHPSWQPLAGCVRELTDFPVVYDCVDLHRGWPQFDPDEIDRLEEELARSAHLVLASAPALVSRMRRWSQDVVHVPNGCETERFAARHPGGRLRPPLAGPLIGYMGDVAPHAFDVALLTAIAERSPDWTHVVIGPVAPELQAPLDRLANVVTLGEVPYEELPELLADIDVALLPFLDTPLTRAVDPVKVWEYLAAGLPVVSTALPALHPLQGPVTLVSGAEEATTAIERALRVPRGTATAAAAVRDASWSSRVDLFHDELLALAPSLDVVVISFDNPGPLGRTLASLRRDDSFPHTLIVVDNASADPATVALLDDAERGGATVLRNARNLGYPAAVNQGVAAGTGRYLLLLNDDVQLPRGGTLAFVHHLARSTAVGIVGPVTNRIANEACIDVPYADDAPPSPADVDEVHASRVRDHPGVRFELQVTALFAAAVRRRDYEGVGGLSEHYLLGQFEDDELVERLRGRGLKVVCCEELFVHHDGSSSFGALDPRLLHGVFERNRRVFEATTGATVTPHRRRGDDHAPPAAGTV